METALNIKRDICGLFEVYADEQSVQRIVTPLEYSGSNDRVVVRVRPSDGGYRIDESGDAALYSTLNGGDVESIFVDRWAADLRLNSPVHFDSDESLCAFAKDERLVVPYVFRVAEAAQQLFAIATSKTDRKGTSDFKAQLAAIITEVAASIGLVADTDVELPIAGGLRADHVLRSKRPLIVIAASTPARLLEAEVIHMQYRAESKPGMVLAIAESQEAVGKRQFERAGYYTGRTVVFSQNSLASMLAAEVRADH